ncbi:MAG: EAL domain-containing protein [Chloroflexi bacterium]|nr:EAL domain-containing protein [Chloroflexota bacterium]
MYAAKRAASGFALYSAASDTNSAERLRLMGDLRQAIEANQLAVHYQPKADLSTGQVVGVEALARWQLPGRGLVPPDQFIPLAEHLGLIELLTFRVLNRALEQCRLWRSRGLEVGVAVNLSAHSLRDPELPEMVVQLLRTYDLPPSLLELEVTESAVMAEAERAGAILGRLHERGVRVSIDDFGTGYSSLAYLKRLPVDQIKIDRGFVRDMLANDEDAYIVRTIVELGHNLGLRVVAEGVEDRGTWDALAALGCDIAQGYVVSRPLPAESFPPWLEQSGWPVASSEADAAAS